MLKSLSGRDQILSDDVLKIIDTATLLNRMTALLLHAKQQNARFDLMMTNLRQA